jgi:ABC-2 type transport system permease protein
MWYSFYAIFRKELLHIFRDTGTVRLVVIMQLVLLGFIDETVHDVATIVVDQDRSVDSRNFVDEMIATKTFKITKVISDPAEARAAIRAGTARVGVVIPPKFHDKKLRNQSPQVLVLIDGSDSTVSAQALASINGLVAQENLARAGANAVGGVAAQPIILFNPEGRTSNYLIPGLVAVLLMMAGVLLSANAIVKEKEQGTFEQLLVTPIDPLGLVLGKVVPYLFFALLEGALVLAIMRFAFHVPIRGSLLFLLMAALIYLFALLSLGLLISTRAQTQMASQQMVQATFLPSIFLSGYIFPLEGFPKVLQAIGHLFPVTYMIAIMRGVVLRDANLIDMWPNVAVLLFMSVVLVFLASRSIHKVAA